MPARSTVAELVAELLGTFLFFIVGAGAVIVNAATGGEVGLIGVALAHGLALAVLATAFGPISGGQFNPAVTVALWLVGKVRTRAGARIIVAQLAGAAAAGFVLKLAFGGFDGGDTPIRSAPVVRQWLLMGSRPQRRSESRRCSRRSSPMRCSLPR